MAAVALALYVLWLVLAFGVRIAIQVRRTGATGVNGLAADASTLERFAGVLFVVGLLAGACAPILALSGTVEPLATLDGQVGNWIGVVLAICGIALTFFAQLAMGDEWRVGVDPAERTGLVTGGPFALVRNPIYSAMLPTVLGLALMVPSLVAALALVVLLVALELQVRLVEEPYLLRVHGAEYAAYAARVGRFVPGIGLASERMERTATR